LLAKKNIPVFINTHYYALFGFCITTRSWIIHFDYVRIRHCRNDQKEKHQDEQDVI
jgi:hypothetical protein